MSNTIDEKTKLPLGFIIGIVSAIVAVLISIGTFVWYAGRWTSKMEEKVDNITTLLQTSITATKTHEALLEELKTRVNKIETVGSPKLMMMEKDYQELRRQIEIHFATDKKSP